VVLAALPAAVEVLREGSFLTGESLGDAPPEPQVLRVQLAALDSSQSSMRAVSGASFSLPRVQVAAPFSERMGDGSEPGAAGRANGPLDDVQGLAALDRDVGNACTDDAEGAAAAGAEFFGVQAAGNQFAFVVDCSLSMQGAKWAAACEELVRSVGRLTPEQEFYVIFFDGEPHLMFDQERSDAALVRATPENLAMFRQWLLSARLGYNTEPVEAVSTAVELRPNAVFLLSDGEFGGKTALYLRLNNSLGAAKRERGGPPVAVHTIGFRSKKGEKMLERIARENAGTYRFVE
jgi:hypothetical protein